MKTGCTRWFTLLLSAASLAVLFAGSARAQAVPQVTQEVNNSQFVPLKGNVHPMARKEFDQGAVADSAPTGRLILTLKRSQQQETALRQFLQETHSKGSASYHKWLKPPSLHSSSAGRTRILRLVTAWLSTQGFNVESVGAGKKRDCFSPAPRDRSGRLFIPLSILIR